MTTRRLSVIVPVNGDHDPLDRLLGALQSMRGGPDEMIVVDGGMSMQIVR